MSKILDEYLELNWEQRVHWKEKALAKYDKEMFCPVCRHLLTGLHENNSHFIVRVEREAAKLWNESIHE